MSPIQYTRMQSQELGISDCYVPDWAQHYFAHMIQIQILSPIHIICVSRKIPRILFLYANFSSGKMMWTQHFKMFNIKSCYRMRFEKFNLITLIYTYNCTWNHKLFTILRNIHKWNSFEIHQRHFSWQTFQNVLILMLNYSVSWSKLFGNKRINFTNSLSSENSRLSLTTMNPIDEEIHAELTLVVWYKIIKL